MTSMTITIERTPMTLQWEGQEIQVEQLGIRLPFARKPADLKDMSASGDYVVYVTETRTMTPEEFDGFARIPLLAVLLLEQRLVVPHVDVAGGAGHEELDDALGLGRGMEDAAGGRSGEE